MSIVLQDTDGACKVRLLCDHCEQPINDARQATAIIELPAGQADSDLPDVLSIWITHAEAKCELAARRKAKHTRTSEWVDSGEAILAQLLARLGVTPARYRTLYKSMVEQGLLPPDEAVNC
jgi:hypothetical protein